jgi:glycosyltransferase involved in cell wall biosynthesis
MVPVKGLDVLLDACAILRGHGLEFRLYLVGDGPLRPSLGARIEAEGLQRSVAIVGPKGHDELPDWYRSADLTVLPSRSEGLPNVLRESLSCGTPFVASAVGGVGEIGDESCRLLVPPEDPPALAQAIERGLSLWGPPGRPTSVPQFLTWEESADALLEILEASRTRRPVPICMRERPS